MLYAQRTARLAIAIAAIGIAAPNAAHAARRKAASGIPNLRELYDGLAPSVVTIHTLGPDGAGNGSGIVLHKDGFIATAAHVARAGMSLFVEFLDGSKMPATIATLSRTEDLALLKVPRLPEGTFVPELGDSDGLVVGQPVFAIGAPLGLRHTLTTGIISAIRKNHGSEFSIFPKDVIQTDAALNQGNSGGAVFDADGNVVDIASYIASPSGGSVGLGFAVPSNAVRRRLFNDAIPYLGVTLRRIPDPMAEVLNWPRIGALLVEEIRPGSSAANAGLRAGFIPADLAGVELLLGGDLIVKVGEYQPAQKDEIHAYLHSLKPGDKIHYTVLRGGQVEEIDVVLEEWTPIPKLPEPKRRISRRRGGR